jgi:phosphoribosylformimino-5-aminoimidazole carboxamide ribotide isomerase
MQLYPAIDLMDGKVVRLEQGRADRKTVYSDDPVGVAQRWELEGGDWLHLVDLDAAFTGQQRNLNAVRLITAALNIPCELGGGMRSLAAIEDALEVGVKRIVIGTRAVESLAFVETAVNEFGADRIAVGIDAKNGVVAVKGWTETSTMKAVELATEVASCGVRTIIYTDVATDGMLAGPNYEELALMMRTFAGDVIASGGVSCEEDLEKLAAMTPRAPAGAIIGKALYDGRVDLANAASLVI